MLCITHNCKQTAISTGRFCSHCFQTRWGVNPNRQIPLPLCLINIVDEYLSFNSTECAGNWELMYISCHKSSCELAAWTLITRLSPTCMSFDMKVLPLIADRYCRSNDFWNCLLSRMTDPYEQILFSSLDDAHVYEPYHPIELTLSFMQKIYRQQNDNVMWTLLHFPNVACQFPNSPYCDLDCLFANVFQWRSKRVAKCMLDLGWFENKQTADRFLQAAAANSQNGWSMFLDVYKYHYSTVFCKDHTILLRQAMKNENFQILDFLISLKGAKIHSVDIADVVHDVNSRPRLRAWIIRNKHRVATKYKVDDLKRFRCTVLLQFFDNGVFRASTPDTLTNIIIARGDIDALIQKTPDGFSMVELFVLLPRMTHLGTQQQLQTTARRMCAYLSLYTLKTLFDFPVIKRYLTFTVLRNARPDFLLLLVRNGFTVEDLDWIAAFCDNEQQMLSAKDIDENNNALLRFAHEQNKIELQKWILTFLTQHQI